MQNFQLKLTGLWCRQRLELVEESTNLVGSFFQLVFFVMLLSLYYANLAGAESELSAASRILCSVASTAGISPTIVLL